MKNPFKFGTIVEDEFFTDRVEELKLVRRVLDGENHLILISPRRFGKSSLIMKAVHEIGRPYLWLNMQRIIDVPDFAAKLLKETLRIYPWEKLKHLMSHFRMVPLVSMNPLTNGMDVSFQPAMSSDVLLEDVMRLLERVSTERRKLIVVFDEFQEVHSIGKGLDKQLRALMQEQKNLNYIIMGSQESMMTEIFERKKSPFYHFGRLMHLKRIPHDDFYKYIKERMAPHSADVDVVVSEILSVTQCHPYYTQQLASQVWELLTYEQQTDNVVETAINQLTREHDLDFERLWVSFNQTDKRILLELVEGKNPMQMRQRASSTQYSALKRMMQMGYVIRNEQYEVEDPFFKYWIRKNVL